MKDYDLNAMVFELHFERQQYPAKLIIEAAVAARNLDRKEIIFGNSAKKNNEDAEDEIFLITTFNPKDL